MCQITGHLQNPKNLHTFLTFVFLVTFTTEFERRKSLFLIFTLHLLLTNFEHDCQHISYNLFNKYYKDLNCQRRFISSWNFDLLIFYSPRVPMRVTTHAPLCNTLPSNKLCPKSMKIMGLKRLRRLLICCNLFNLILKRHKTCFIFLEKQTYINFYFVIYLNGNIKYQSRFLQCILDPEI